MTLEVGETVRIKGHVVYSETTGILGVRGTPQEAKALVTEAMKRMPDDTEGEWLFGAHGLWSMVTAKKVRFFIERHHYDYTKIAREDAEVH